MKRILVLLVLSLFIVQGTFAQTTPVSEKIVVDVNDLTPEQIATLKEKERLRTMEEKVQAYGKWVGIGNEIGVAVKEGLSSVVEVADDFGETKVGEFTLIMIAWKVMGQDIIRILLGIVFIIISVWYINRSARKLSPYKIRTKGGFWQPWVKKEYEVIQPEDFEGKELLKWFYVLLVLGSFGFTYLIMFG